MCRKIALVMTFAIFLGMLTLAFNIQPAASSLPVHNIDTGLDYATIQEAINANETLDGHTIMVDAGVYYENVVLNKTLSLVGENRDFTVIDANGTGNGIVIQADYGMVENFTIQNGGFGVVIIGKATKRYVGNVVTGNVFRNNADAVGFLKCDRNIIANNTFESNGFNIIVGWIDPFGWGDMTSNNNTIVRNNMTQGFAGILILYSKHNVISENNVSNMTDKGITFLSKSDFPYLPVVTNNSISNNVIVNCTSGLVISGQDGSGYERRGLGCGNNITGNVIQQNELGVYIFDKGNNTLSNNKVADNVFGMYLDSENNVLRGNEMNNNLYNFVDFRDIYYDFLTFLKPPPVNDIDTTNTINGKHIYYLLNQSDLNINPSTHPDMGYLVIRNCINVTIANMTFSNNGVGLAIYEGANITIENVTIQDNLFGISATHLVESKIRNSIFQNNLHGLSVVDGEHLEVKDNSIMNNSVRQLLSRVSPYFVQSTFQRFSSSMHNLMHYRPELLGISGGIFFWHLINSTVTDNVINGNERGIYLRQSDYNFFRNNTMTGNVYNFGVGHVPPLVPLEWIFNPPDPPQISPHLINDVDASNTVDGKPIYWWINRQGEQVPNDAGYVVLVNCTNMIIKDLVLQNNIQGMLLVGVNNATISNNVISDNKYGINLPSYTVQGHISANNTIIDNYIKNNGFGIETNSPNTVIAHNIFDNNLIGLYVRVRDNMTISENMIINSANPPLEEWIFGYPVHGIDTEWLFFGDGVGIILEGTNTTVRGNTIKDNHYGISVAHALNNRVYHNNFINNTEHVFRGLPGRPPATLPPNTWDNNYPSGGNYWSNYTGVDLHSGSNQDETGSDSIGDTPYVIDENNVDNYPLMAPYSTFDAGTWNGTAYNVGFVTNSTVSNFEVDAVQKAISFNVTGSEFTTGFCRVAIPNIIVQDLWQGNYTVLLNGEPWTFRNWTDTANTYLYINYTHSEHQIVIIPEFPSTIILPLLMITTLLAVIIHKRKHHQP